MKFHVFTLCILLRLLIVAFTQSDPGLHALVTLTLLSVCCCFGRGISGCKVASVMRFRTKGRMKLPKAEVWLRSRRAVALLSSPPVCIEGKVL